MGSEELLIYAFDDRNGKYGGDVCSMKLFLMAKYKGKNVKIEAVSKTNKKKSLPSELHSYTIPFLVVCDTGVGQDPALGKVLDDYSNIQSFLAQYEGVKMEINTSVSDLGINLERLRNKFINGDTDKTSTMAKMSEELNCLEESIVGPYVQGDVVGCPDCSLFPKMLWCQAFHKCIRESDPLVTRPKLSAFMQRVRDDMGGVEKYLPSVEKLAAEITLKK